MTYDLFSRESSSEREQNSNPNLNPGSKFKGILFQVWPSGKSQVLPPRAAHTLTSLVGTREVTQL